ncbi:hypothetical protein HT576_03525 [Haloterrigena sp. SYSU A121-1]|uniref:Origin-associated protein OapC n=1 Tax=Haloterrigena gelatinilytica TaxID=2741724 RepID=A0A8J8KGJ8_9EURY|nr:Zn-ribbon containing protein [Haloterrigena gelatinilytica]NUB90104.1 hypothetical protein [Haloterrigena gelatinilytica]
MPHECTNCGRTFPDGSKEMLSGCPDCGGNKFQFAPAARAATDSSESAATRASDSTGSSGVNAAGTADDAGTVERAAETVRDWVSSGTSRSADASATDADDSSVSGDDSTAASSDPTSAAAAAGSTPTDGTRRDRSTDDRAERSWPSSDEPADGAEATPAGEFEEWPETARRPEDRSPSEADSSSASASPSETDASSASASTSTSTSTMDASSTASSATSAAERADSPSESIMADSENDAQADARSEVVSTNDLPDSPPQHDRGPDAAATPDEKTPPSDGRVVSEPSGEQPSIEELREELNEQFESIKIVSPGQYELNLMELYNREEYIISLQEDGRYVIDVPDSWRDGEE